MAELTKHDLNTIKKTWAVVMEDPEESGGSMFVEYFTNHPRNQEKFPRFKGKPANELITVPEFRKHGAMIMHIFDDSIKAYDSEPDEIDKRLKEIWRPVADTHFWKYHVTKKSYDQFRDSLLDLLKRLSKLSPDEVAIWRKLLDQLHAILFCLYDEYEKQGK